MPSRLIIRILLCLVATMPFGCVVAAEGDTDSDVDTDTDSDVDSDAFIAGAELEPCSSTVEICQVTAGCVLAEDEYLAGSFPGFRNFVVRTPDRATLAIRLFFEERRHPGEVTEIIWFEPGCADSEKYDSNGADIIAEAGDGREFIRSALMQRAGDHLIEIYSDAHVQYLLRVEVSQ